MMRLLSQITSPSGIRGLGLTGGTVGDTVGATACTKPKVVHKSRRPPRRLQQEKAVAVELGVARLRLYTSRSRSSI
jgi:hypothetical protein